MEYGVLKCFKTGNGQNMGCSDVMEMELEHHIFFNSRLYTSGFVYPPFLWISNHIVRKTFRQWGHSIGKKWQMTFACEVMFWKLHYTCIAVCGDVPPKSRVTSITEGHWWSKYLIKCLLSFTNWMRYNRAVVAWVPKNLHSKSLGWVSCNGCATYHVTIG